jgi:hypothetical protein
MGGQRNRRNTQLRRNVVVLLLKMSTTTSVPAFDIPYELAMPRTQAWRGVLDWLRQSRSRPQRAAMTGCFGRLTAKDEMVAKGLAASLTCSTERGQDRW